MTTGLDGISDEEFKHMIGSYDRCTEVMDEINNSLEILIDRGVLARPQVMFYEDLEVYKTPVAKPRFRSLDDDWIA